MQSFVILWVSERFAPGRYAGPYRRIAGLHPRYWAWLLAMLLALIVVLVGARASYDVWQGLQQQQHILLVEAHQKPRPVKASAAAPATWLQELPRQFVPEAFVAELNKQAGKSRVSLIDISVQKENRPPYQLGQVGLEIRLKGAYPDIKALLALLLQSHPGLSVDRLTMRLASGSAAPASAPVSAAASPVVSTTQDAAVSLTQWLAPLPAVKGAP